MTISYDIPKKREELRRMAMHVKDNNTEEVVHKLFSIEDESNQHLSEQNIM